MNLSGKVCLITGSTGGIGGTTALELARCGADIVLHGRGRETPIRRRVEELGRRAAFVSGDVADPSVCADIIEQAATEMGRLDVVVHAAGGAVPGGLMDVRGDDWYRAFDVHVHAVFHLVRAAVPHMRKQGEGAIVLVSSAAGARGCLGAIAYGVAKGALPQFTRVLARELAGDNIRVNCVSPGIIRTRFQDFLTPQQVENNVRNRIPLHREGTAEDVARLIATLVENDFITGEDVAIDGGMTMRIA